MRVVAGIIFNDEGKVLIGRKRWGKRKGLWEFPGGKVKEGEEEKDSLKRELLEELGLEIEVGNKIMEVNFRYPDTFVALVAYSCRAKGKPSKMVAHSDIRWVPLKEIIAYDLCGADREIARKFLR